ncbi:hypothetical protein AMAG_10291 [Allomyces macrogynus ATCC 38327]|uniref:RAVE complex protein Rav1 C-terminal domain-containing protein n=1 Tax=Allomyces macrogynus (strain ATCC 38327) TaxID=578462 RepID=A0A0L0SUL3_ALLM3|nr:hypothetical protein AMAG_10291 [Allomyces macrogynus ATCC 38327]|eukprot:KNE66014.1 hypothetical protein AMAG_10291 [Allomyces macrogynus ATCC 38327]
MPAHRLEGVARANCVDTVYAQHEAATYVVSAHRLAPRRRDLARAIWPRRCAAVIIASAHDLANYRAQREPDMEQQYVFDASMLTAPAWIPSTLRPPPQFDAKVPPRVTAVASHASSGDIAAAWDDGRIIVYKLSNLEGHLWTESHVETLDPKSGHATALLWRGDDLFSASSTIKLWDTTTWTCSWSFPCGQPITYLSLSPGLDSLAAAGDDDRLVKVWRTDADGNFSRARYDFYFLPHPRAITSLAWQQYAPHHLSLIQRALCSHPPLYAASRSEGQCTLLTNGADGVGRIWTWCPDVGAFQMILALDARAFHTATDQDLATYAWLHLSKIAPRPDPPSFLPRQPGKEAPNTDPDLAARLKLYDDLIGSVQPDGMLLVFGVSNLSRQSGGTQLHLVATIPNATHPAYFAFFAHLRVMHQTFLPARDHVLLFGCSAMGSLGLFSAHLAPLLVGHEGHLVLLREWTGHHDRPTDGPYTITRVGDADLVTQAGTEVIAWTAGTSVACQTRADGLMPHVRLHVDSAEDRCFPLDAAVPAVTVSGDQVRCGCKRVSIDGILAVRTWRHTEDGGWRLSVIARDELAVYALPDLDAVNERFHTAEVAAFFDAVAPYHAVTTRGTDVVLLDTAGQVVAEQSVPALTDLVRLVAAGRKIAARASTGLVMVLHVGAANHHIHIEATLQLDKVVGMAMFPLPTGSAMLAVAADNTLTVYAPHASAEDLAQSAWKPIYTEAFDVPVRAVEWTSTGDLVAIAGNTLVHVTPPMTLAETALKVAMPAPAAPAVLREWLKWNAPEYVQATFNHLYYVLKHGTRPHTVPIVPWAVLEQVEGGSGGGAGKELDFLFESATADLDLVDTKRFNPEKARALRESLLGAKPRSESKVARRDSSTPSGNPVSASMDEQRQARLVELGLVSNLAKLDPALVEHINGAFHSNWNVPRIGVGWCSCTRRAAHDVEIFARTEANDKWRKSALKNAFVLLGKQRYELAAAFFLLAESPGDAVTVCLKNLNDPQLALLVAKCTNQSVQPIAEYVRVDPQGVLRGNPCYTVMTAWMLGERSMDAEKVTSPALYLLYQSMDAKLGNQMFAAMATSSAKKRVTSEVLAWYHARNVPYLNRLVLQGLPVVDAFSAMFGGGGDADVIVTDDDKALVLKCDDGLLSWAAAESVYAVATSEMRDDLYFDNYANLVVPEDQGAVDRACRLTLAPTHLSLVTGKTDAALYMARVSHLLLHYDRHDPEMSLRAALQILYTFAVPATSPAVNTAITFPSPDQLAVPVALGTVLILVQVLIDASKYYALAAVLRHVPRLLPTERADADQVVSALKSLVTEIQPHMHDVASQHLVLEYLAERMVTSRVEVAIRTFASKWSKQLRYFAAETCLPFMAVRTTRAQQRILVTKTGIHSPADDWLGSAQQEVFAAVQWSPEWLEEVAAAAAEPVLEDPVLVSNGPLVAETLFKQDTAVTSLCLGPDAASVIVALPKLVVELDVERAFRATSAARGESPVPAPVPATNPPALVASASTDNNVLMEGGIRGFSTDVSLLKKVHLARSHSESFLAGLTSDAGAVLVRPASAVHVASHPRLDFYAAAEWTDAVSTISLWPFGARDEVNHVTYGAARIHCMQIDPAGGRVAVGDSVGEVAVHNLATLAPISVVPCHARYTGDSKWLVAILDAVGEPVSASMDDNGKRVLWDLVLVSHLAKLDVRAPPLTPETMAFAFFSDDQPALVEHINGAFTATWDVAKELGVGWWLMHTDALHTMVEIIARHQWRKAQNPHDCFLFYLMLGKKKLMYTLWKQANGHAEQQLMTNFLGQEANDKWRKSALKNAFVLLGKQRYELAAAFFLLAESPGDAVTVCLKNLNDPQLALLVAKCTNQSVQPIAEYVRVDPQGVLRGNPCYTVMTAWMLGERSMDAEKVTSPALHNVALWDTLLPIQSARVRGYHLHESGATAVAYNGHYVVSGGKKGDIRADPLSSPERVDVVDMRQTKPVASFQAHGSTIAALAVTSTTIYSGSTDGTLKVWDLAKATTSAAAPPVETAVFKNLHPGKKFLMPSLDKMPAALSGITQIVAGDGYVLTCGTDGQIKWVHPS